MPISERTLPSRDPEIAELAISCICLTDCDLELLPSIDCSPMLSTVDSGVVCHTAIIVDLDLAMRYPLAVTSVPTVIGRPYHGSEKIGFTSNLIVCNVDRVC